MEVSAFVAGQLKEQLKAQRDHDEKIRKEMEAKLEKQRLDAEAKLEAQKEQADAKLERQREEAEGDKRDQRVAALQARLEALHAAKLLADEELFALEDAVADALDAPDGDGRAARMVALSARMAADAAFARQLRRKFA